jgi:acetyl-CoA carboxylase carboxyltransferase component/biotin carboxyl carrier protein
VIHLYERECTLQRRHQKLVEIACSPDLAPETREALTSAATLLASSADYRGLGTFEFLLDVSSSQGPESLSFIEANPRLQVEHTVTEMVTGIDLVQLQLRLAAGETLEDLSLPQSRIAPRGHAIQARVNMERVDKKGRLLPSGGTLAIFETPSGPGVRTDTFGYAGYATSPSFDSLLAKVIVHSDSPHFPAAVRKLHRALREFRIEGVETNLGFLQRLLEHPDVVANDVTTDFVETHMAELAAEAPDSGAAARSAPGAPALAGSQIDRNNPLAVLEHGKGETAAPVAAEPLEPALAAVHAGPPGTVAVEAPLQGTIVSIDIEPGAAVSVGHPLLVMEAMKMEHVIAAERSGIVRQIAVSEGDAVFAGHPLVYIEERAVDVEQGADSEEVDLDHVRPDLAEVIERHEIGLDEARPEAVARRRKTGQRTTRENIADLCDPGTYIEYGPLVIAAQRRRRSVEDLVRNTPADGMVAGIGAVNGDRFSDQDARCVLMSYDYTVLAGTQGGQNHRKKDRLFELAERWRLPVVFFTEGGGGRPGDTDGLGIIGLDCLAFQYFGRLSGLVPLIGINSGRCFAGNAALLGCCDVEIATENSNIGMGGPAMIEGGGLGIFRPEEVGPIDVQRSNGVVDIVVRDEAEAVAVAKQYLSYFQGSLAEWECADQRRLRSVIPENRLRIYDVREVIEILSDASSVLELRRDFGLGMVTALVRIEGRPVGIIANNPTHLAGAIDSDAADKASRFMQLCDAFDIPLLFLCDTPGIMVGPEVEQTALVRHAARMFVTGASISVPFFTIVLRKSYGLGAQAMAGGSFKAPVFTISWPTGEFGGMGLEGAVKLGYRKELAAIEDPAERLALYEQMVERMYEHGKAVNVSSHFELDDVIDPMESRDWILRALRSMPPVQRNGKKRPSIDTW